ncbi:hypothetical protein D915_003346 [Fasciola hepatica]|uniref:Uncharacterized protein n=1 Tax=Fasciola hepatica TaxID=6192 RepID=A0A4E0RE93_FASHE|nr:hypothetical protein D915_003346 [Fasciola hepatica]
MSCIEQTYQPRFNCADLLRDDEVPPELHSRPWNGTHWKVWKNLTQDYIGVRSEAVNQCTQTDPCIWNEEQLEVLRCCKIEMGKYIKQLESLCEEQKERIDVLNRRCIAHNILVAKLSRLKPVKHDKSTGTENVELEPTTKTPIEDITSQTLREKLLKMRCLLKTSESSNRELQVKLNETQKKMENLKTSYDDKVKLLAADLSYTRKQLKMKEMSYREVYKLMNQLREHLHRSSYPHAHDDQKQWCYGFVQSSCSQVKVED